MHGSRSKYSAVPGQDLDAETRASAATFRATAALPAQLSPSTSAEMTSSRVSVVLFRDDNFVQALVLFLKYVH
jgi:hypothetical protein